MQLRKKGSGRSTENLEILAPAWGLGGRQAPDESVLRALERGCTAIHVGCLEKHPGLGPSPRDSTSLAWGQPGKGVSTSPPPL